MRNSGVLMFVLIVLCVALVGCNASMVRASKLERSVNLVVKDYLPKLAASDEPASIKKANARTAIGLKEIIDRALYGADVAKKKREELEAQ
jgi:hypothetical protein